MGRNTTPFSKVVSVTLAVLLAWTVGWAGNGVSLPSAANAVFDDAVPMAAYAEESATDELGAEDAELSDDSMQEVVFPANDVDGVVAVDAASGSSAGEGSSDFVEEAAIAEPAGGDSAASPEDPEVLALSPDEEAQAAAEERETAPDELGYFPGEIVVIYEDDANEAEKDDAVAAVDGVAAAEEAEFATGDAATVQISDDLTVETAVELAKSEESVKYAMPNYMAMTFDNPTLGLASEIAEAVNAAPQAAIKSDDRQASQWYLDYIKAPQAWNLLAANAANVEPVKVVVLDTGASLTHPDLTNIINKKESIEVIYEGAYEGNTVRGSIPLRGDGYTNGSAKIDETTSHGTHVSGIIAAESGNGGVAGVASGGTTACANKLVSLTVIDAFSRSAYSPVTQRQEPSGGVYDILYGLCRARDLGADVVNMSLGFATSDADLKAALEEITTQLTVENDMLIVAAAGNNGAETMSQPAVSPNVLGVMSVSDRNHLDANSTTFKNPSWISGDMTRSWFSNYGSWYNITAPGERIYSTYLNNGTTDTYAYLSGTSMACPVVAAVAAMVRVANPALTATEVSALLCDAADDLYRSGKDDQTGHGMVNAEAAVSAALEADGSIAKSTSETAQTPTGTLDPLAAELVWSPSPIKCGSPTSFTIKATGGSGNYKYLQNMMMVKLNGYYTDDSDWTYKKYAEDNTFKYTFVASGSYRMRVYVMDMETKQTVSVTKNIEVSDSRYPSIEKVADNIVKSCEAKNFKTQYEEALFLHDWIINNASYDHSLEFDGESGVLIRGKGTCESYHRAFTLLLNRMGIQCERATGNGHVWSCVKLDGKWTQIDPTWNGDGHTGDLAFMNHLYFGITDDMMKQVHSEHKPNASRPCTSYDSNYFLRSGEISRWTTPLEQQIRARVRDGQPTSFTLTAEKSYYPNVYNIVYPLAAYQLTNTNWGLANTTITVSFVKTASTNGYFSVTAKKKALVTGGSASGSQTGSSSGSTSGSGGSSSSSTKEPVKVTGVWKKTSGKWWYSYSDGTYAKSGWALIGGTWYLFDSAGWMKTGWQKVGGTWYYLASSGAMKTGWQKVGGAWYYLASSGAMKTGWQKIGGSWYYLKSSGAMAIGWQKVGGKWYHLKSSGAMSASTWVGDYYVNGSGVMETNKWIGRYYVGADGKWSRTR
ncbi:S8 family serine peptidase [Adlercreutzia muris]|uniref:S8 family serine peptidase n=1 Tax=Adlercreutzia muris TaxID=1796610 RepID=UPI001F5A822C|nr:S8 family serine peptidase [Adlercreutzia muris]